MCIDACQSGSIRLRQETLVFPPRKSGREIWGFEISYFPVNLCRDPRKFFHISKDFRGTEIYYSDIKNALL